MITKENLEGKNIRELKIWGQKLWFVAYFHNAEDALTALAKVSKDYRDATAYWQCKVGCNWKDISFDYHSMDMEATVMLPDSLVALVENGWFGLASDSPYCEEVEGDGIGFEVNREGEIIKAWLFFPGE